MLYPPASRRTPLSPQGSGPSPCALRTVPGSSPLRSPQVGLNCSMPVSLGLFSPLLLFFSTGFWRCWTCREQTSAFLGKHQPPFLFCFFSDFFSLKLHRSHRCRLLTRRELGGGWWWGSIESTFSFSPGCTPLHCLLPPSLATTTPGPGVPGGSRAAPSPHGLPSTAERDWGWRRREEPGGSHPKSRGQGFLLPTTPGQGVGRAGGIQASRLGCAGRLSGVSRTVVCPTDTHKFNKIINRILSCRLPLIVPIRATSRPFDL